MAIQNRSPPKVDIPAFEYRGFRFPGGDISVDINNLDSNKPAYKLCRKAPTLAELRALYELGLGVTMEEDVTGLENTVKGALSIYDSIQSMEDKGEWTADGVDYKNGKKHLGVVVPGDYIAVRWVNHPAFKEGEEDDEWEVLLSEDSREFHIFLPPDGYVIPTMDGLYRPDTGAPFATVENRKEAIRLIEKSGLYGENEVSYWRRAKEIEISAVRRWFHDTTYGSFYTLACCVPDRINDDIGARYIRRAAGTLPLTR